MVRERIASLLQKWTNSRWFVPVFLFGIAVFAFGLFIPKLGYYMDDWHHVYYSYVLGDDGLADMLLYGSNRPYATWFYVLIFNLVGHKPLGWHVVALLLRWGTVVVAWQLFRSLWKDVERQNLYAAMLFLIYPFFMMQPMAVAYALHWMGFFLFVLSLWFMVLAEKKTGWMSVFLIALALVAEWYHLVTSEYFSGAELVRPLILWFLLAKEDENWQKKLWRVFRRWLPYLLVLGGYVYWRFVLLSLPEGDRNTPVILLQFLSDPMQVFLRQASIVIQDAATILFDGWHDALSATLFDLSSFFNRYLLLVVLFSFGLLFIGFRLWNTSEEKVLPEKLYSWHKQAMVLGFSILFLGPLPVWFIGQAITTHKNKMAASRFGFVSMLGAALILAVVIDYFITNRKKANLLLAALVALSIGVHLRNANSYEYAWDKQVNFYQQFVLRVPALEDNTAVVSSDEILMLMGEYPTAYALNAIYSDVEKGQESNIWFYALYSSFATKTSEFFDGMPLKEDFLLTEFDGNSHDIIFVSYVPGKKQCLWVLRPEDSPLTLLTDLEREASLYSNIARIQTSKREDTLLPSAIFNTEMPQNWCSYYQRADLARQRGEWQEITALWEEAQSKGKAPANGFEYIPFIEGYAHQNNWGQVRKLTKTSNKISQGMYHVLCPTLDNLEETTQSSSERDAVIADLYDYLKCQ